MGEFYNGPSYLKWTGAQILEPVTKQLLIEVGQEFGSCFVSQTPIAVRSRMQAASCISRLSRLESPRWRPSFRIRHANRASRDIHSAIVDAPRSITKRTPAWNGVPLGTWRHPNAARRSEQDGCIQHPMSFGSRVLPPLQPGPRASLHTCSTQAARPDMCTATPTSASRSVRRP